MNYSIGEVANMFGVPTSTLRYYDREGMLPNVGRGNGGIRVFTEVEVETLKVIECLKSSGMPIKDIKRFLDWCQEGDASLHKRRELFYERKEAVEKQFAEIQKIMAMIRFKCWYYDKALEAGTERVPKNMPIDEMPDEIQKCKCAFSE
jgi:DNA-binding transcriptional MerR regulator